MTEDRWEHGSSFHLPPLEPAGSASSTGLPFGVTLGSGRVALRLLLQHGHEQHGWARVWIPSYYCSDVVESLEGIPLEVRRYPCGPLGSEGPLPGSLEGDVLLRVNYFGWGIPEADRSYVGPVIEDHTHAPWGATASNADYGFASLRKTLPLPDGAVVWSPRSLPLPPPAKPHPLHVQAVELRLAAMALKAAFLSGAGGDKQVFRELEQRAEEWIARGHPSSCSAYSKVVLSKLPIEAWADLRTENHDQLRTELTGAPLVGVLGPERTASPLAAILRLPSELARDAFRAALTRERIYTAVLWPIPAGAKPHRPEDAEFSTTTLAVHVDARYTPEDMTRVAHTICRLAHAIERECE